MKTLMLSLLVLSAILLPASAETVPVRWLEGVRGYQKALELQKTTKQPILVWVTENGCGYCAGVTTYLN